MNLGALLGLFVTCMGDRYERRPLLISTTLLFALFSGLTATASNVYLFGLSSSWPHLPGYRAGGRDNPGDRGVPG